MYVYMHAQTYMYLHMYLCKSVYFYGLLRLSGLASSPRRPSCSHVSVYLSRFIHDQFRSLGLSQPYQLHCLWSVFIFFSFLFFFFFFLIFCITLLIRLWLSLLPNLVFHPVSSLALGGGKKQETKTAVAGHRPTI